MGNKVTKMNMASEAAISRGKFQGKVSLIVAPPINPPQANAAQDKGDGDQDKGDGDQDKGDGDQDKGDGDQDKGDGDQDNPPPQGNPPVIIELKTAALARLKESQDLIANEITTQIHEWIEDATVQWRNGVEVCDIMGITRTLDMSSTHNSNGPPVVRRKASIDDDDCCIVVYNRTQHPVFVQSEFLPGYRRRLNKIELGVTAAPGAGTGTFGFEIGNVKVEAINLERLIVFPGKLTLIQVGSREQSFITVDIVYNEKEINLYTDKKMYYAQCLVIGGEPIDETTLKALHAVTPDKKPDGADGKKNPNDGGVDFMKAVLTGTLAALEAAQKKEAAAQQTTTGKVSADGSTKPPEASKEG